MENRAFTDIMRNHPGFPMTDVLVRGENTEAQERNYVKMRAKTALQATAQACRGALQPLHRQGTDAPSEPLEGNHPGESLRNHESTFLLFQQPDTDLSNQHSHMRPQLRTKVKAGCCGTAGGMVTSCASSEPLLAHLWAFQGNTCLLNK